jgi:hypothetical protein
MPTNAEMAAKLLRSAAEFFRSIGSQNDAIRDQMNTNADTFLAVADLVENDPNGITGDDEDNEDNGDDGGAPPPAA